LTLRTLLYGYETWEFSEQDKQRITSREMKFRRRRGKYTWQNYRTGENI